MSGGIRHLCLVLLFSGFVHGQQGREDGQGGYSYGGQSGQQDHGQFAADFKQFAQDKLAFDVASNDPTRNRQQPPQNNQQQSYDTSNNDRSFSNNDRTSSNNDRTSSNNDRSSLNNERSSSNNDRSSSNNDRSFSNNNPQSFPNSSVARSSNDRSQFWGTTPKPSLSSTRNPFDDPNRYRIPQARDSAGVRFVNGQPYIETFNVKDKYGNRYDPRAHSIPGVYDPENDPKFSDPQFQDPRNLPKYDNNRHKVPKTRLDSKYRYYDRFPERRRDQLRDPNYDPRFDPDEPHAPGVLGGWLPELQGECRPGCENLDRDVTVNTNYGRVNGFFVYLYDGPRVPDFDRPGINNVDKVKFKVSVFLGIPYAMPPVGAARLMPPRPHRGWQSYDAVDWAPVCPQPIKYVGATKNAPLMDEDCLFLNVFTPTVQSSVTQLFPVMVYIHGGQFEHGSANEFPGHQLAANGRVVVVALNYRLGALGFLSTGDHHAPGNYGLLDMALAIKWVSDNIYAFQGDKDKITVFGPGAGAASAGILAVMPKTRKLVRQVIAISGSPLADWAVFPDKFRAMNTSKVFGERVGCTIDSSWQLVDCIRKGRSFHELTNIEFKPEFGTWPWAPVVQLNISVPEDSWHADWVSDEFMALPELVSVMYENQQYHPKFKYITGAARDDASYMIYNNRTLAHNNYELDWKFFDSMVRDHIWQYNYTLNPEGIFNAIKYMYTYYPDPNNKTHIREEFINFWSDYFFKAPQDAIVKLLVHNRVDTYMYVQNTTVEALKLPWWRHIDHNLEHYFLSGSPFMDSVFFPEQYQLSRHLWTESDRNMSQFFIYAFANFSWWGNPTPKNILGVHWDMTIKGEILKFLAVNTTENSTTYWNYRQKECAFWTEYLPSVIGMLTPTYPPTTEFWWEPDSPLQVAFWSMSSVCLFLLVLVVVCCLLWRNAKRNSKERYFDASRPVTPAMSLKNFPNDHDHLMNHERDEFEQYGSELKRQGSIHSLGVLGLMPVPVNQVAPPVPSHGIPNHGTPMHGFGAPNGVGVMNANGVPIGGAPSVHSVGTTGQPMQNISLPPTPTMSQKMMAAGQRQYDQESISTNKTQGDTQSFMRTDPSLESLGGTRAFQEHVINDAPPPKPITTPRTPSKLVPGRMTSSKPAPRNNQGPVPPTARPNRSHSHGPPRSHSPGPPRMQQRAQQRREVPSTAV